jgi:hypothetical protein
MKILRMLSLSLLGAAFAASATPAHADRDAVHFFSNIHVASNQTVHDAVCFFCNVDIDGEAQGDVVVFFGNVHISGRANHDVVNFFGGVSADDNAQIGESMVSFFSLISLGDNVSVGKDLVSMFGVMHAAASVTVGGDRVAMPFMIFLAPLMLIGLMVTLVVRAIRDHRRQCYYNYPFPPQP